ncbi:hypothetical protein [Streptomyces sp. NPDC046727]|uniref:hypothetical protein n=1 Tax=Streptomyces sp. NPDC046727 TaxID=3155373 RepID=UPI0033CAA152
MSTSAEGTLSTASVLSLSPLRVAQLTRAWAVEVTAADLARLAAPADAARRLGAGRGYLGETGANTELARMLADRPEDFGAAGQVVLGAEAVEVRSGGRLFADTLHVIGPECIDGLQRLKIIAGMRDHLPEEHLRRSVIRLEIYCGAERDRARRLYDVADRCLNVSTAQDRLIRCPSISRLMRADWEKGDFDPRRGMTTGPHALRFSMAEVTRALACLSADPQPVAAHMAATPEGREALWEECASPLYRSLFHGRMTPVGVMRAVEAWTSAHRALAAVPKKSRQAHGRLVEYAPELICWQACRGLPLRALHDARSSYPWERAIEHDLPAWTVRAARNLVARYEEARPGRHAYHQEAPKLELWLHLTAPDGR